MQKSLPMSKHSPAMQAKYSIRPAGRKHLKAIPAIELAAVSIFTEADIPLEIRYRVTEPDVLRSAQDAGRLWIALDINDQAVGFAMLEIIDGLAHIDQIDVHPDHAKQGVGARLLQTTIDWATREGYTAMTLITFRHLAWNAPFYERYGFAEIKGDSLSPGLRWVLRHEAAAGLDARNRIA